MSRDLCAPSPSESTYLAKLKLLSFQGLICVTPMEGLGGGLMRHKMMINEFIGRCSSNKGWRASVRTGGLAAVLSTAGFGLPGSGPTRVSLSAWTGPWIPSQTLAAFCWPAGFRPQVLPVPPPPPAGWLLRPGGGQGSCGCRPRGAQWPLRRPQPHRKGGLSVPRVPRAV